jgi:ketosteroid isomerase-like protein/mono/diheme cytochrome c family protein
MNQFRKVLLTLAILCLIIVAGAAVFVYSGLYNVGADDPHTRPMFALMQTVRSRSIHARSKDILVPKLHDEQLILKGAGQYAAMCTGCHLKPGTTDSEIRSGLYPQPPNLSQVRVEPQDAFWVIKHGLKMSAMPAWGLTHDDNTIWSMVAFLQKLPDLTPAQYKDIVAKAPPDEDMDMGEEGGPQNNNGAGEAADEGHSDTAPQSDEHDHDRAAAEAPLSFDGLQPKGVPAAEAVAASFHTALQKGDREAVLAVLAQDVTISEGGQAQSRDEYASGHLGEDIAFLKSVHVKPVSLASMPMGETAMVGTETQITSTAKEGPTTLRSRELLTLKRQGAAWKIVAVRWQSAPAENAQKD